MKVNHSLKGLEHGRHALGKAEIIKQISNSERQMRNIKATYSIALIVQNELPKLE